MEKKGFVAVARLARRALVITRLIIHQGPRHHCNCYTSDGEKGRRRRRRRNGWPTPHFSPWLALLMRSAAFALRRLLPLIYLFIHLFWIRVRGALVPERRGCRATPHPLTQFLTLYTHTHTHIRIPTPKKGGFGGFFGFLLSESSNDPTAANLDTL